ncbi:hypothetical protein [Sediminitomix flava]|uniref:Uncharacterized protein n=1 Tax=Sediminitomix flava TaxID=379075 RepID=A0A315ZI39_SEDFL|nr:hypothetical protein [Sediminitomix flava]PWJ44972.1 hypothetical protein BC781_1011368 [Sediminitomix flava]
MTKSKTDLIFDALRRSEENGLIPDLKENDENDMGLKNEDKKSLSGFPNMDIDSIKPKKQQIEYSSVKLRTDLYERIREAAEANGVKQPGKFISLILETYLQHRD